MTRASTGEEPGAWRGKGAFTTSQRVAWGCHITSLNLDFSAYEIEMIIATLLALLHCRKNQMKFVNNKTIWI